MSLLPVVYRSSDPGAPALTGQVGSLTALLDAVLVTGYGSGAAAKPAAGWTIAATASDKRAYRNSPTTGTGCHLRVDDSSAVGNARIAHLRAYAAMSDVDTGTEPAPTASQMATGMIMPKSSAISSLSRGWFVFASERYFYLFVDVSGHGVAYVGMFCGDFVTMKPGDAYNFALMGNSQANWTGGIINETRFLNGQGDWSAALPLAGGWVIRGHTLEIGSTPLGFNFPTSRAALMGGGGFSYPDAVSGGLMFEKIPVRESAAHTFRGYLPNVYQPLHALPFGDDEVVEDIIGLPSTTLLSKWHSLRWSGPFSYGSVLFDLTNEW